MNVLDESLVADLPPFRKLAKEQIREILDRATSFLVKPGAAVFDEGEIAEHFYLLLDGHVRVVRCTPHGEQVIALHIASGQLFGIAAALGKNEYPATAVTVRECLVLSWPNRLWERFANSYDGFASETYKIVGARMEELNDRVMELATQQVEQRVASVVLRLVNQAGKEVDGNIEIDFPITRQDLSEMTGTTLHTVSRMLSAWERDGVVASQRSKITITDPHRLVVISERAH